MKRFMGKGSRLAAPPTPSIDYPIAAAALAMVESGPSHKERRPGVRSFTRAFIPAVLFPSLDSTLPRRQECRQQASPADENANRPPPAADERTRKYIDTPSRSERYICLIPPRKPPHAARKYNPRSTIARTAFSATTAGLALESALPEGSRPSFTTATKRL